MVLSDFLGAIDNGQSVIFFEQSNDFSTRGFSSRTVDPYGNNSQERSLPFVLVTHFRNRNVVLVGEPRLETGQHKPLLF
jgi:hypothetical protein